MEKARIAEAGQMVSMLKQWYNEDPPSPDLYPLWLGGLNGSKFESNFLKQMSEHHSEEIEMSAKCAAIGTHVELKQLCARMQEEQRSEQKRLRQYSCEMVSEMSVKSQRRVYLKRVPERFAHLVQSKLQFPKVTRRTATSIVLLTVLLAGVTPTGVCALICESHARAESQRHCSQLSGGMPGMAHGHSAMNHSSVEGMSAVLASQSCQTNCVTADRLNVWRRIVPQVTVVRSSGVVLATTAKFLAPDFTGAWGLDSGPPAPPPAHAASFSILRI
jgi:hypothetical protein